MHFERDLMPAHSSRTRSDVRERILHATLTQLVASGPRSLKSGEIAQHAGTSESTLFRHYKDVSDLLHAVYEDCWSRVNEHLYLANSRDPGFGTPEQVIAKEFDHLWSLKDEADLRDLVLVAMTYFQRPQALGSNLPCDSQQRFQERITGLCRGYVREHHLTISAEGLQELLTNFAATVFLTWTFFPRDDADLTPAEARLSIIGLLRGLSAESPSRVDAPSPLADA
ncbi:TetR/AcrR family transcriptional regulator [Modestobacter sp. VKM Ac-2979]|uniref:TetR/AcrR family transcriptional regulator n=1 Tax=unclassified Modestobacter TaxID=2643866 RepID=UPI0022AB7C98|nr:MULTISPECIES: TetR/AcrR family transcriptional regulator [unclassified Modestobacter]MCZ2813717.1 TetR/AcrR family transcriptional regulator [Modestobacter sp. VKM Ac-2979]MCZ2844308.1 TetR/AcrR family transcriptional regulator [Modestobacter sp. VKM Ac-2980]